MDKYLETFKTWDEISELYEDKFMGFSLYDTTYDYFCNELTLNSKVLDLGCGPGNITKYLNDQRNDLRIRGIDVSQKMIDLAIKNNPNSNFEVLDIRNLENHKFTYNGIICGFCIPYLSTYDLENLLPNMKKILKKDGILYLSFVEGNKDKSGFIKGSDGKQMYFYFHNFDEISQLLLFNGFKTEKVFNLDYENSNLTKDRHTIIISKLIS